VIRDPWVRGFLSGLGMGLIAAVIMSFVFMGAGL
jgi:hypothetical protein